MRFGDRVVLITGSGSGIGRATAFAFAAEGAKIAVVDWFEDKAQETAAQIIADGGAATALTADVADAQQVETMVASTIEAYGRLDVLVNNAAIATGKDILETSEEVWDKDIDVVLKGVFLCSKAALPTMIEQGGGVMVNIASVNGLAGFGNTAYSAAKAGVINLTKNAAMNFGKHNIRVNAICPGTIRTPVWEKRLAIDPQVFEKLAKWYPLGRVGEPEDVAKAVLFLASDDAAWITGTALIVDGGLMSGMYHMTQELIVKGED
jgi:NAD(P)-dependent dehydrogenase (short-subunit alcohol dehydrogenase family)